MSYTPQKECHLNKGNTGKQTYYSLLITGILTYVFVVLFRIGTGKLPEHENNHLVRSVKNKIDVYKHPTMSIPLKSLRTHPTLASIRITLSMTRNDLRVPWQPLRPWDCYQKYQAFSIQITNHQLTFPSRRHLKQGQGG